MTPSDRNVAPGTPSPGRRRLRTAVVVVAAMIAVLYLVVFFIQLPHMREPDNPAPVYVPLALAYVVGAVLVAVRDRAWVRPPLGRWLRGRAGSAGRDPSRRRGGR